jgi:pyruvate dehydrogenase E1 component beta subunit
MELLAKDKRTIFIGYNLKYGSKGYGTLTDVPAEQILETLVAENLMAGLAIGMALQGLKPVLIFERQDFMLNASDAIINHLSKIKEISKGQYNPKVIIRAIIGAEKPFYPGVQHIQDLTDVFENHCNFPVVTLNSVSRILYCYENIKKYKSSVMFIEERGMYERS